MARSRHLTFRMIRRSAAWIAAISTIVCAQSRSQQVLSPVTALDIPADSRSVGLGEGFAGIPANLWALSYNPAGLSGLNGVEASYAYRSWNWLRDFPDLDYHSAAVAFSTPLFNVGIQYTRADQGEFNVTNGSDPQAIGRIENHSDMLALGFARPIVDGLSCGLAVKGFAEGYTATAGDPGLFFQTYGSFCVDIGMMYTGADLTNDDRIQSSYSVGASLQNFGSELHEQLSFFHIPPGPAETVRLPRYFRFGASYCVKVLSTSESSLDPAQVVVSVGYRNLLNPLDSQSGNRDFWGWGLEISAYEILTLRMGGYISGITWIYGSKGSAALRYGGGIAIPLAKLGTGLPVTIRLDVAAITVPLTGFVLSDQVRNTLPAFSFGIVYDKSIF